MDQRSLKHLAAFASIAREMVTITTRRADIVNRVNAVVNQDVRPGFRQISGKVASGELRNAITELDELNRQERTLLTIVMKQVGL